jgi:RNA methyltransferase, TrmH family
MSDVLSSRDNPWAKQCRALAQEPTAYRQQGLVWLEGDHLLSALCQRGHVPDTVVCVESRPDALARWPWPAGTRRVVVSDRLMAWISGLPSPPALAGLHRLPPAAAPQADCPTVVLDRLQDPGNVGSVLRSAAAFGVRQVLALKGTAALWSPKVLRAGMGAHFGLHLVEGLQAPEVLALGLPCVATSSHDGEALHQARLPWPCAWLMGHEGQGVSPELLAQAPYRVRIPQPGGEESLNVAAAAAICLYTSSLAHNATRL